MQLLRMRTVVNEPHCCCACVAYADWMLCAPVMHHVGLHMVTGRKWVPLCV